MRQGRTAGPASTPARDPPAASPNAASAEKSSPLGRCIVLLTRHWKFALIVGVCGSLLGCKSPVGSTLGGAKSATTSPSAGALAGAGAATANPVAKAWKSTTDSVAKALTIKPKTIPAEDPV